MPVTLPAFVLVGVPRAGTTSLYRYLGQHPQVWLSEIKEINFLSYPGEEVAASRYPWLRFPVRTIEEYERLFARGPGQVAVDFSASCFRSPVAIDRIRRFVPDARLFVVLRDPVARAWSAYLTRVQKRYESRPPHEAMVRGEPVVDNSFYSERLEAFQAAFGADRLRVWLFDDLTERPAATVAEVFAFLGVDPEVPVDLSTVYNKGGVPRSAALHRLLPGYQRRRQLASALPAPIRAAARRVWHLNQAPAPTLPPEVATRLRALYRDDVLRVERLIGRDLGTWLDN
ncbi:MAG: sulfotransferase family protein [Acidimicrobiales bacterium]